jgi:hypothetical protein
MMVQMIQVLNKTFHQHLELLIILILIFYSTDFILHLTSMPDQQFQELIGLPQSSVGQLVHKYIAHSSCKLGPPPSRLSPTTEILFILLHLHHYPVDVFLASIFLISKSTCQAIKICIDFLYNLLSPQLVFPDYNYRWAHKKEAFYPGVYYTWVVDGSEQPISGSSDEGLDTLLYSSKKNQHSITLIFVTMNGWIMGISSSYSVATNDLQIEELHSWNHFEPTEQGMGDAGF